MLKKTIVSAECVVEFDWYLYGSVLAGSVRAGASECRTHLSIDSPESSDDVALIVRLAKQGCFAERAIEEAVPLRSSFELNGNPITIDAVGDSDRSPE